MGCLVLAQKVKIAVGSVEIELNILKKIATDQFCFFLGNKKKIKNKKIMEKSKLTLVSINENYIEFDFPGMDMLIQEMTDKLRKKGVAETEAWYRNLLNREQRFTVSCHDHPAINYDGTKYNFTYWGILNGSEWLPLMGWQIDPDLYQELATNGSKTDELVWTFCDKNFEIK